MKTSRGFWPSFVGIVIFLSAVSVVSAQRVTFENGRKIYLDRAGLPLPEGKAEENLWTPGDKPENYSHWTAEAWTGSDAPFMRARRSIDDQVEHGQKPLDLLRTYRTVAQEKPMDAPAQFRWAYAAFVAHEKWQPGQDRKRILAGVSNALERPRSPKSYEYARMRAIFTLWDKELYMKHYAYLPKVVKRLAKRNPRDYHLKYIFAYDFSQYKVTNSIALEWAKEYRKAFPNKPAGLFLLGRVYEGRFGILVSESNGKKAIGYFRQYMAAVPATSIYRPAAQWHIEEISRRMARFRSRKMLKP